MISRVADHCFWFGRYIERAEATARMLAASVSLALDAELPPALVWRPVVVVSGEEARFASRHAADDSGDDESPAWGDGELVQRFMVWDEDSGVSLTRSIQGMRWNARSIREVLSHEAWEAVNELHLWMRSDLAQVTFAQHRDAFYQHVRRGTQLVLTFAVDDGFWHHNDLPIPVVFERLELREEPQPSVTFVAAH